MPEYIQFETVGVRNWGIRPVAIVGGGPSLQGFDFQRLKARFTVLAVNASMFDIPFAAAGFSLDRRAMREWWPRLHAIRFDQYYAVPDNRLHNFCRPSTLKQHFLRRYQGTELTVAPSRISAGGTSGFGALHFAFLKGAKRIVLFGYDYGPSRQIWHHNESHYHFPQQQNNDKWAEWARNFNDAARVLTEHKVEVINASPDSAITAFPKLSIEQALLI